MKKNNVDFWDFYYYLSETIKETIPDIEWRIVSGGDYVQNIVLEFIQGDKRLKIIPYELYDAGCSNNDYEDVVENLINFFSSL